MKLNRKTISFIFLGGMIILTALFQLCKVVDNTLFNNNIKYNEGYINENGKTIEERFLVPQPFERIALKEDSFEYYLRNLYLKDFGEKVYHYDGKEKRNKVYVSVIDMDIGNRDLQQCADAVMRLRGEYLYSKGDYNNIHFNFTNGFNADYNKWVDGYRIVVEGNSVEWIKGSEYDDSYETFREYMNIVFTYAGTLSLSNELVKVKNVEDIKIGDIFIQGGSPGHAVIVVDVAINLESGDKVFLLAQSYMPAQSIHILKNPNDEKLSPWFSINGKTLVTPEWTFDISDLMRFE